MQYYKKEHGNIITYWKLGEYAKKHEIDIGLQIIFEKHTLMMNKLCVADSSRFERYFQFLSKIWGDNFLPKEYVLLSLFSRTFKDVSSENLMFWGKYIDGRLYEADFNPTFLRSKYMGILMAGFDDFAIKLFVTEVLQKKSYAKRPKKPLTFDAIRRKTFSEIYD